MKYAHALFLLSLMGALFTATGNIDAEETASFISTPVDSLPTVKKFIQASYPQAAVEAGIQGTVKMEVFIHQDGLVDSARVLSGLRPDLDSAALQAMRQFEFTPAQVGGVAVPVAMEYGYVFKLDSVAIPLEPQVNFKGRLREKGTRAPIAEAMVVVEILDTVMDKSLNMPFSQYLESIGSIPGQNLEDGRLVTSTDAHGYFSFKSLPACSLRVSFPVTGYQFASFKENLVQGKRIEVDYRIRRDTYEEYEIVVYGRAEREEVAKTSLSAAEAKKVPGFGGDAIKVVRALPGVARPPFISGEILIRGAGPDDSRFLLDGVPVIRLFHFGAIRSIYNSDFLSSIDMYPGGFSTRYGGAIGGVVEVKGRPALKDRWHGKVDINLMDAGGRMEGPLSDKLALQVSGIYSYIGDVIKSATAGQATTVAPLYRDAYARLDWDIDKNNQGFLTYSFSQDDLEIISGDARGGSGELSGNTSKGMSEDWFHMAILGLNSKIGSSSSNELRMSLVQSATVASFFGAAKYGQNSKGFSFRDEFRYAANKHFTFKPGVDLSFESFDFDYGFLSQKGVVAEDGVLNVGTLGTYANVEIRPVEKWLLVPGIRYEYYNEVKEGLPSFRMATRYEYLDGLTAKGSVGTYTQAPRFIGITAEGLGNPDLPPTEAVQYTLGHEWRISDLLSLDVQGYFNTQKNIPNATDSLNPLTGKDLNYVADMDARMYGLEMLLRRDQGKRFFGWISYSLSRSERRAGSPFAPDLYAGNENWDEDEWVLWKNDQTHNLQVVGGWRLPRGWEAGFRFQYVTGIPASPLRSMTHNEYLYDSEIREYVAELGEPFSDRVGPFMQLDLRVDKRFVYRNWILSAYLDISNANFFFYNSPEIYDYSYDNSSRKAVGALFFPSLGLTAEF